MIFYGYDKCSTCRKAKKALTEAGIAFEFVDVTQQAPSVKELEAALAAGIPAKKLINTSGQVYRSPGMKEKVQAMTDAELLQSLSNNGRLLKRPFIIDNTRVTVGYQPDPFTKTWL